MLVSHHPIFVSLYVVFRRPLRTIVWEQKLFAVVLLEAVIAIRIRCCRYRNGIIILDEEPIVIEGLVVSSTKIESVSNGVWSCFKLILGFHAIDWIYGQLLAASFIWHRTKIATVR